MTYLLIVYGDLEQKSIIFLGIFNKIKDIVSYTNNAVRYSDIKLKDNRCYKTYKNFFQIIDIEGLYFNR